MDPTAARTRQMRLPIIAAHFAQVLLAIIVLGLAAYGVDYISYNVLIYSLVVVSWTNPYMQQVTELCIEHLHSRSIVMDDRHPNDPYEVP